MAQSPFDNRLWGGLALRGVVALLFGFLALARPGITAASLTYLFGAYVFIDGIFALVAAVRVAQMHGRWWGMLLVGILGLAVGVLTFLNPSAAALGLVYYIAAWAIVTGIFEIAGAFQLRQLVPGEWLLAISGALSIAFGVLVAGHPGSGLLSIIWLIGMYAIVFGVLQIGLAFRILGTQKRLQAV